jgi:hypothetical protein
MRSLLVLFIAVSLGCAATSNPSSSSSSDAATDAAQPVLDASMMLDAALVDAARDAAEDAAGDADSSAAHSDATVDGGDTMCGSGIDIRSGAECPDVASGVYAIKTVLDVWWRDDIEPSILDPGRGYITMIQKATLSNACEDGNIGQVELQACGLALPPFSSWLDCGAYQLEAPEALWDSPRMPRFVASGMVSEFGVGGVLSLTSARNLIGIQLLDSASPWPASYNEVSCGRNRSAKQCFPDHDFDELPGVRFAFVNAGTIYRASGCGIDGSAPMMYDYPRVDALAIGCVPGDLRCRASHLDVGIGVQLDASASIAACAEDTASLSPSSSADTIALRAGGCSTDEQPCDDGSVEFVDSMLPEYLILAAGEAPPTMELNPCYCAGGCNGEPCALDPTPSVGPRTAMVRLGDAAGSIDCAAVRAAVENEYPGTSLVGGIAVN